MAGKKIYLNPNSKHHFWWYVAGILLTPVLGLGIYLIIKKRREITSITCKITDQTITVTNSTYSQTIDLVNINHIDVHKRWIDKKFGIGTLSLQTGSRTVEMPGMENPQNLANLIMKAAESERIRLQKLKESRQKKPTNENLTKDKLDYLTGLWQQGLISNEDFEEERKHFES